MMLPPRPSLAIALAGTAATVTLTLLALPASSLRAQTYAESGDAGQTPGAAQGTAPTPAAAGTPLTSITGTLSSSLDADLFFIAITNPAAFSVSTVGNTLIDTQVFLFTIDGAPLFTNNDEASGLSFQSTLPAGFASSLSAGSYLLGISANAYDPIDGNSRQLFADPPNGDTTTVRGPAFATNNNLAGFIDGGVFAGDAGPYGLTLTGAATAVPEPSTVALLAAAGAAGAVSVRRRRRSAAATRGV